MGEYSGNHPRFSRKQEERYDAKEAHNKDLSASARLHYLENDETHHPAKNLADSRDIKDMSGAYNAMGDPNSPAPHKGAMKGDQSATHRDYAHYKGTDPNYHGHTGASHGDQSATHRDYMHGHPARQGMWDTIKKVGRTIGQGAKDIGYQALDMISSDPGGVGGTGARADKDEARRRKFYEQRNYDISRAKAASGETYGSLGDYFDDSGYGNFLGIGADSKRGAKGSAQPNTLQNKLSAEEERDIRLSKLK